ncbi:NAD(P)-binding domain-containing protein, partial [Ralstonia pseudosolanacearum]
MVSMSAEVSSVSVGWIGAGRLARALAVRASHAGMRCAGVASRTPAHAASLAEAL